MAVGKLKDEAVTHVGNNSSLGLMLYRRHILTEKVA